MTSREVHLVSTVPVAFLAVAVGHHPAVALPLVVGVLLPELDAFREETHRSWLLHTFLFPTLLYQAALRLGLLSALPAVATTIHFLALGMGLHFVADYVYPRTQTNPGAEWPVRPVGFSSPWGLLWLGISWAIQWYGYLAAAFLPWLGGV
ncbi:hypothetical protein AUR64_14765 [Haloprofundus marisrubri]|uniref:Uncharacterized protein n=1 Tax=Haloprofundus marisrubri TaxID=1514971 RepID=A0A0W1R851_9EURY|nr:hypothetical protein AUR64_14765 [Haloprofundus marisrubri]